VWISASGHQSAERLRRAWRVVDGREIAFRFFSYASVKDIIAFRSVMRYFHWRSYKFVLNTANSCLEW